MTTSLLRRSAVALAATASTAALTLLPSAGAYALPPTGFVVGGNADASWVGSGGGDCTLTSSMGSDDPQTTPVSFTHGSKTRQLDMAATFTSSLDAGDRVKVKGHIKSTLTLHRFSNHDFRSLDLTASGDVTLKNTVSGSHCRGAGSMFAGIPSQSVKVSKKGVLHVSYRTNQPSSVVAFILVNATNGHPVIETLSASGHLKGSAKASLKPGHYFIFETEVGVLKNESFFGKASSLRQSTSADLHLHASFTRS
jgi:hypothetical protein